ncbi:hypothetical protein [Streptomyces sp. NPDC056883]|uniref:hypothetical protein n=1 Tax=Streptomyces sp. NPDC056883 TaxID=3345959 RepID=UPI0036CB51E4
MTPTHNPTPNANPTEAGPPYASPTPTPTVSGHAYPWDVVGDPAFADRVRAAGLDSVTLAVSYHSTRAATPLHPGHRFVDARHSALYRPVRAGAWAGRRLVPTGAAWVEGPDPAAAAALALSDAGIPVSAWLVLAHNSLLGTRHPDLAVTNCFGETYPYGLCPAQEEVREYCATLAAEALRDLPPDAVRGVSLESAGQLGAVHAGCHEKTDGAYPAAELRALSVCCCTACRAAWQAAGLDPDQVTRRLRGGQDLPAELGEALLRVRHQAADALRGRVLEAVRATLPGAEVTLHAHPDPWATGPSPGLTESAPGDVDALLVPCWPTGPESAELVWQAVESGLPVNAYVTALPPADPAALPAHVRRLRAAGATRLSLYHLGLLPRERLPLLAALAKEFRA